MRMMITTGHLTLTVSRSWPQSVRIFRFISGWRVFVLTPSWTGSTDWYSQVKMVGGCSSVRQAGGWDGRMWTSSGGSPTTGSPGCPPTWRWPSTQWAPTHGGCRGETGAGRSPTRSRWRCPPAMTPSSRVMTGTVSTWTPGIQTQSWPRSKDKCIFV